MPNASGVLFDSVAVKGGERDGSPIACCACAGKIHAEENATTHVEAKTNVRRFMMPPPGAALARIPQNQFRDQNTRSYGLRAFSSREPDSTWPENALAIVSNIRAPLQRVSSAVANDVALYHRATEGQRFR
jgi:hypothetical protein